MLRLCTAHGLYSALVYVHNRINEYRQPVLEMLACLAGFRPAPQLAATATATAAAAAGRAALVAVARKLLVYLRCTFRGQAFPPGSGLLDAPGGGGGGGAGRGQGGLAGLGGTAGELRAQLLGLLLFTDVKVWPWGRERSLGGGWACLREQERSRPSCAGLEPAACFAFGEGMCRTSRDACAGPCA